MELKNQVKDTEEMRVRQAVQGDLEAFNQLVLDHQDMAYHHALALIGDPASAEDAVQESFIKAFQSLSGFRGGSFRAWLLRIVTNSVYDMLRRSQRRPTQPLYPEDEDGEELESAPWLVDPNASVEGSVERSEKAKHIYQLLDELPEVYRNVITLIDLYELEYTEAAQALKVPIGTVKSRLARARMQMKEKLTGVVKDFDMPQFVTGSF